MSELAKLMKRGWSVGFIEYRGNEGVDGESVFAVSLWRHRTNPLHGLENRFGYGPTLPKAIRNAVDEAKSAACST